MNVTLINACIIATTIMVTLLLLNALTWITLAS